ncbi:MAG: glycosyltransferase [Propioniciclava sp.]|uniref:glycosyltransferase family 2 protein n=1 Tax=Propioniciclava sp. TaxID=2038686 RepID=UPI0039E3DE77
MPNIAVVIPTLGSRPTVRHTLESLSRQTLQPVEIVVVNQGDPDLVQQIVGEFPGLNITLTTSARGLSRARNHGIRSLASDWDYLATPDDDIIFNDDALERLTGAAESRNGRAGAVSGYLRDFESGQPRLNFPSRRQRLTRGTVWTSSIEATMLYSREAIDRAGTFDETLGLGAGTRWGSGEGTDLLLRIMDAGYEVWFEPEAKMSEMNLVSTDAAASVERVRSYARGTGRVFALRESSLRQALLVLKSLMRIVVHAPSRGKRQIAIAILQGRLEGLSSVRRGRDE